MSIPRRRARRPWEADLAAREARTRGEAKDRAHRGRALVDAALAGQAPAEVTAPAEESPPAGYEYVACAGCYRPIWALPGSRCPACKAPPAPPTTPDSPTAA
ncbi:hypothetical protein GA0070622_1212 [Micromonospora sediminicola]|uniref:Uncharacterized protein n=1 Tax=Micromonospora sediminicola TaxID=946078 RepID=A0A1A9B5Q4_9ACTN|nr:hypothetical protein [Micromonospora sediminicola]SBT64242.1 hypothetical protein GA0070622_1212 [Micromonospora sediminicola]